MQKEILNDKIGSPFFELMSHADEIQVQEVDRKGAPGAYPAALTDSAGDERVFIVNIKQNRQVTVPISTPARALSEPVLAVPTERDEKPQRSYLLENAGVLLKNGDYILARNVYSYLLQQNIRDREALRGLGICFTRLGEPLGAKKCFTALWELYASQDDLLRLALCHLSEGNDKSAIEYFKLLPQTPVLSADLLFDFRREFGNALTRTGSYDLAEVQYRAALQLQPNSATVYVNLGTLEVQRQNLDGAQAHYLKASQIDPKSSRAHCGLGLVDLAKGDYFSASKEFNITLDLDSQNVPALVQLVELAEYSKAFTAVKVRLVRFLTRDPKNTEVRFLLARVLFSEGGFNECEKEIDAILRVNTDHAKARKLKDDLTHNKHHRS